MPYFRMAEYDKYEVLLPTIQKLGIINKGTDPGQLPWICSFLSRGVLICRINLFLRL
jgi:hypothetical protein